MRFFDFIKGNQNFSMGIGNMFGGVITKCSSSTLATSKNLSSTTAPGANNSITPKSNEDEMQKVSIEEHDEEKNYDDCNCGTSNVKKSSKPSFSGVGLYDATVPDLTEAQKKAIEAYADVARQKTYGAQGLKVVSNTVNTDANGNITQTVVKQNSSGAKVTSTVTYDSFGRITKVTSHKEQEGSQADMSNCIAYRFEYRSDGSVVVSPSAEYEQNGIHNDGLTSWAKMIIEADGTETYGGF